jgi:hypothetical protein
LWEGTELWRRLCCIRERVETDTRGVLMGGYRRNEKALLQGGMSGHRYNRSSCKKTEKKEKALF